MPGLALIGQIGNSARVREHPGGVASARELFDYLRVGATIYRSDPNMTIMEAPAASHCGIDPEAAAQRSISTFPEFLSEESTSIETAVVMDMSELVDDFLKEPEVDYVGLWEIAQASREDLGAETKVEVRKLSLEMVRQLYDKGLRPGNYWGGDFDYWPDEGLQAALDRIEREWVKANADPNLAEPICWFAPRPT
jgi:hypothetical protein